jgi:hypothetical protein
VVLSGLKRLDHLVELIHLTKALRGAYFFLVALGVLLRLRLALVPVLRENLVYLSRGQSQFL